MAGSPLRPFNPFHPFNRFHEMKAIYINLDPYLAAFAAWIKGGKSGPAPHFDPLPLAVTVPLGESAAIYLEKVWVAEDGDFTTDKLTIDGTAVELSVNMRGEDEALEHDVVPGLSAVAPAAKYAVFPVTGDVVNAWAIINDGDIDVGEIRFTVLVRREQAQGPVDLVDFTAPSAVTAASINTALGGTGAEEGAPLAGVSLGKANIVATNTDGATTFTVADSAPPIIIKADSGAGMNAALGADTAS